MHRPYIAYGIRSRIPSVSALSAVDAGGRCSPLEVAVSATDRAYHGAWFDPLSGQKIYGRQSGLTKKSKLQQPQKQLPFYCPTCKRQLNTIQRRRKTCPYYGHELR